ncbi:hypothetical protein [Paracidobacterium acidisoli]|uniref:hypothetical protein n=1 Tax=Paracidobacterium acidisoli TaxID=2303751 RepID=UPI00207A3434|nr:hypothetical protein [Paracidobacterium acidisoli]
MATAQVWAQDVAKVDSAGLPDAPDAVLAQQQNQHQNSTNASATSDTDGKQTKRILGIVPNFRSVSANVKLPPQTVKEKFIGATEDSFDYSSFIFAGLLAGVAQAEGSYPEFHQGAAGYARYYWHTFADQADENYQVEFFWPVATHEDPRYYTLGHGGFFKRTAYSFSRILITRTDSGRETVNISEIAGAGSAAGISDLYYPSGERSWTKTGQRWVTSVSLDGATFIFKEFWPDINGAIFHQKN